MNDPKLFSKLNPTTLEELAGDWAERYPVIEKILLFKYRDPKTQQPRLQYVLVVIVPRIHDPDNIRHRNYQEFLKWSFGGESCDHVMGDLLSSYYNDDHRTRHSMEWIWFPIDPKDPPPTDFLPVMPGFSWVLYDCDAQAREEDAANTVKPVRQTKLRPDQQVKINCQEIAKKTWEQYPLLDIVHMINLPEIKKIIGRFYKGKTVHDWLKVVAPDRARKGGKRGPAIRAKQEEICKKLKIEA